ncbi:MAG TPA: adenosylcobinamide-GDP ribazoletransferase [Xanthobacteraceae bacterium]|nr:adenosylcobinamide-GDP ribazoletransferase [Xanthobacteraceae bacterium]
MTGAETWLRGVGADLRIGMLFSTRIPLPHATALSGVDVAGASWTLPVIGALIGLLGASIYWLAFDFNLPPLLGAALAVTATLFVTGCLHEDGLADTFDGLGGGRGRERKLEIMRDSRIGTYGACALAMSLLLRVGALASLARPGPVTLALMAANAGARAMVPLFLRLVPPARPDGLSAGAGRPTRSNAAVAALLGLVVLLGSFGVARSVVVFLLLLVVLGVMRWLCLRQIGGQTGDVAGALEQIGEIVILLTAAADRA